YEAVRIWSNALGPTHPFVAFGLSEVAAFESKRGRPARALPLFERALEIRKRALGATHPDVALTLTDLASALGESRQMARALRSIDDAIDILTRAPSRDADLLARALTVRAGLEQRQDRYADARATLADALTRRESIFGAAHARAAETRADLARVDFA